MCPPRPQVTRRIALTALFALTGCGGAHIARTKAADLPATLRGSHIVEGVVYLDVNANGWRDQSEPSIPDLPILLDGTVPATTDPCGQFAFSGLAGGFHRISVDPAEMPAVYSGAPRVSQNIRAGKESANARFEVAVVPPRQVVTVVQKTATVTPAPPVSATALAAALEADKAKAQVAIREVAMHLERIKTSGYAVLVRDIITRIDGSLADARQLVEIGDPAAALRLVTSSQAAVQEARKRIESETRQPLRW